MNEENRGVVDATPNDTNTNNYTPASDINDVIMSEFNDVGLKQWVIEKAGIHVIDCRSDSKSQLQKKYGVSAKQAERLLNDNYLLVAIPYRNKKGEVEYEKYKPIPEWDEPKYIIPYGYESIPYILPEVWAVKEKPHKPIIFTEGEKKALLLSQYERYAISLQGVWNIRGDEKTNLHRYIEQFKLKDRTCYIAYDSDFIDNPQVRKALYELAFKLFAKDAIVKIMTWSGAKGIDDFLAGKENPEVALSELEANAIELLEFCKSEHDNEVYRALALSDLSTLQAIRVRKRLHKRFGVTEKEFKTIVEEEREKQEKDNAITTDTDNIVIVHPAYDVKEDFQVLGFRETFIAKNKPMDENFYIVSSRDGKLFIEREDVFDVGNKKVVVEKEDRLIPRINEKWNMKELEEFIHKPSEVNAKKVYHSIINTLKQFVLLRTEEDYMLLAGWVMATYFSRCSYTSPYLNIFGGKGSGKSRVLNILAYLCFNAEKHNTYRLPSIGAIVDDSRGVYLLDQAEPLSLTNVEKGDKSELICALADSYQQGGGKRKVLDTGKGGRKKVEYDFYGYKVFANQNNLHFDLKDRCIQVCTKKVKEKEAKRIPEPMANLPIWKRLRGELYKLMLTQWMIYERLYENEKCEETFNRIKELWKPLKVVLQMVNEENIEVVFKRFLENVEDTQYEISESKKALIRACYNLVNVYGDGEYPVEKIGEQAEMLGHKVNKDWTQQANHKQVGMELKELDLYENKRRAGKQRITMYQLSKDKALDASKRYGVEVEEPETGNSNNGNGAKAQVPLADTVMVSSVRMLTDKEEAFINSLPFEQQMKIYTKWYGEQGKRFSSFDEFLNAVDISAYREWMGVCGNVETNNS